MIRNITIFNYETEAIPRYEFVWESTPDPLGATKKDMADILVTALERFDVAIDAAIAIRDDKREFYPDYTPSTGFGWGFEWSPWTY